MSAGAPDFLLPLLVAISGVFLFAWALLADASRGRQRCPKCWYTMLAANGLRCPECGNVAKSEQDLHKTRPNRKLMIASLLPFAIAAFLAVQPKVQRDGWWSIMPTTLMLLQYHHAPDDALTEAMDRRMKRVREEFLVVHPDTLYQWQWAWLGRRSLTLLDDDGVSRDERLRYLEFAWAAKVSLADHPLKEDLDEALTRHLHHSDAAVRHRAVQLCHHRDFDEWVNRLAHLATDEDAEVRRSAFHTIGELARVNERALDLTINAVNDEDGRIQEHASMMLRILAEGGGRSPDAVRALREAVARTAGDRDSAHFSFVLTLPALLDGSERLLVLHEFLTSPNGTTRYAAMQSVQRLWPASSDYVGYIIRAIDDPNASAQTLAAAAWLLSDITNTQPLSAHESDLRRLTQHDAPNVRGAATAALARIAIGSE